MSNVCFQQNIARYRLRQTWDNCSCLSLQHAGAKIEEGQGEEEGVCRWAVRKEEEEKKEERGGGGRQWRASCQWVGGQASWWAAADQFFFFKWKP